jgi:hypothetical protein
MLHSIVIILHVATLVNSSTSTYNNATVTDGNYALACLFPLIQCSAKQTPEAIGILAICHDM